MAGVKKTKDRPKKPPSEFDTDRTQVVNADPSKTYRWVNTADKAKRSKARFLGYTPTKWSDDPDAPHAPLLGDPGADGAIHGGDDLVLMEADRETQEKRKKKERDINSGRVRREQESEITKQLVAGTMSPKMARELIQNTRISRQSIDVGDREHE